MLKKSFTIALLLLATVPLLKARTISISEAAAIAEAQMKASGIAQTRSNVAISPEVAYTSMDSQSKEATLWVFNNAAADGYVVVAADDMVTTPVLGYSDSGKFSETDMPDNMKWWLDEYSRQIEYLRNHPEMQQNYTRSFSGSVEPIVKSRWNQSAPYNLQCPTLNGKLSVTGCVATATAQIMNYYKHPQTAVGSITYYWTNGAKDLSATFDGLEFDWDNMLNIYNNSATDVQNQAVAKLMKYVGHACKMNYSPEASGTQSLCAARALINNFRYASDIIVLERDYVSISEFEGLMVEELNNGRPIYYSGATSKNAGHAYVCDGYNSNGYFHINWGWGGVSDGYFLTTALGPEAQGIGGADDAFNYSQCIFLNIRPDDGTNAKFNHLISKGDFKTSTKSASLGQNVVFSLSGSTYNYGLWDGNFTFNCGIYDSNNQLVATGNNSGPVKIVSMDKYYYGTSARNISVPMPSDLEDGTYTVRPIFKEASSDVWEKVYINISKQQYVIMNVQNGTVQFAAPTKASLKANIVSGNDISTKKSYSIEVEVSNVGMSEYYGQLTLAIREIGVTSENLSESDVVLADILGGETRTYNFVGVAPSKGGELRAVVLDGSGNIIGEDIIDVEKGPASLSATKNSTISNPDVKTVVYTCYITNNGGDFDGTLSLGYYKSVSGKATLLKTYTKEAVIPGDNKEYEIEIAFEPDDAEPGATYTCILTYEKDDKMTEITQRRTRKSFVMTSTLGVNDIFSDSQFNARGIAGGIEVYSDSAVEVSVYNVAGAKVSYENITDGYTSINLPEGVYIVKSSSGYTTKVVVL